MLQNLCIQKTYTQKIPNKGLRCQRARCSVGHTWAPTHRRFHLAWVGELCMCERSRWNGWRVTVRASSESRTIRGWETCGFQNIVAAVGSFDFIGWSSLRSGWHRWNAELAGLLPVFSNLRRLLRWFYGLRI